MEADDFDWGHGFVPRVGREPPSGHVLDGTLEPGKVFDQTVDLEDAPDGYRAMAERKRSRS